MYKEVLRAMEDVSIYPIISLTLFFVIFSILMIKMALYDRSMIKYMSDMPLDDNESLKTK